MRLRWQITIGAVFAVGVIVALVWAAAQDVVVVASVASAAIGVALLIIGSIMVWPQSLIERRVVAGAENLTAEDRLKAENDVRAALLQAITGLVLAVGAGFTLVQLVNNQKTAQAQILISERGQLSDRFTKAVSQLGDNRTGIRLGAIYGLDKITQDAPSYAGPSLRVVVLFVRERLPGTGSVKPRGSVIITPDVRAAIDVATRAAHSAHERADLSVVYLSGATLSRADLSDADLQRANVSKAYLARVALDRADLSGADLSQARLPDASLVESKLNGANLANASAARVNGYKASLRDANLASAVLASAHLSHTDLSRTNLGRANLSKAELTNADLSAADLSRADLSGADLSDANLSRANMSNATLARADVAGADLSGTQLQRGQLTPSQLDAAKNVDRVVWKR